jgi:hypothetical protein
MLRQALGSFVLCMCLNGFVTASSLAQSAAAPDPGGCGLGTLDGYVRDPSGRLAFGARVTLIDASNRIHAAVTVARPTAYFRFDALPLGEYTVHVELKPPELKRPLEAIHAVRLSPQRCRERLPIALTVSTQAYVAVSEQPSTALPGDGTTLTFSHSDIEGLRLAKGRTLQDLLSMVPGVVVTETSGTQAQFTAVGQRRFANRLTIDGVSADLAIDASGRGIGEAGSWGLPATTTLGSTQTVVSVAAIEEIQIRTTNAAPEHAHTPGAQTSVITRSGNNQFRGCGFVDTRPTRLAAADWFVNARSIPRHEARSLNYGESLGGPIVLNRAFFFAAAEVLDIDRSVATTIQVPSLDVRETAPYPLDALLRSFPWPNGPDRGNGLADFSHQFPVTSRVSGTSLRVDVQAANTHQFFVRIHDGVSSGDELSPDAVRLPALSFSQRAATSTQTLTAGLNSSWSSSSRRGYEMRVNITRHRADVVASPATYGGAQPLPASLLVPEGVPESDAVLSVSLFPDQGGQVMSGRTLDGAQRQFQLANTFSYTFGSHVLRFGGSYTHVTASTSPTPILYSYRFRNVAQLLTGRVNNVLAAYRLPAQVRRQTFAMFLQDTWQPSTRLTLNYGLRYNVRPAPVSTTDVQPMLLDYEALPQIQSREPGARLWKTSWGDFQSHISLTTLLNATPTRETWLRAGASVVFDDLTSPGASAFGRAYPYVRERRISTIAFPVPGDALNTDSVASFGTGVPAEAYAIPEHLRAPLTYEWQLSVMQALGRHQIEVGYVGAIGRRLVYWQTFQPPDTNLLVQVFSNDAASDYHALLMQYRRPWSRGLQAQVNYAWSHAIDTDSGEALDPHPLARLVPPALNRGNADFDRRHVLRSTLSYRIPPFGPQPMRALLGTWQIDLVGTVQSGAPVSVTAPQNLLFGVTTVRPDVVPGVPLWMADPAGPTGQRLNPGAFVIPADGMRMGTLGRNTFRGTPLRQLDLALSRSFRFDWRTSEVQFRLEAFNVLNISNFGPPDGNLVGFSFGRPIRSYADALGSGTLTLGGLVPLQQAGGPRALQLGVRFSF